MADAIIIGAGPAGASCALWLARLGFSPIVADRRTSIGGLLTETPFRNDWIVTQPGVTGHDLAEAIGLSLAAAGVPVLLGATASDCRRTGEGFDIAFDMVSGRMEAVSAPNLVIASGVRARTGGLAAGPDVLIGPGGHVADYDFRGKSVAVLGGGDNAFENYEHARQAGAAEAHVYARTVRAAHRFTGRAGAGDIRVGAYEADTGSRTVNGRRYDVLLVMYGWEPRPVFAPELGLPVDEKGYLAVDFATCATPVPGVFAIGEVTRRGHPCVVTAMADGVTAAKAIQARLEGRVPPVT